MAKCSHLALAAVGRFSSWVGMTTLLKEVVRESEKHVTQMIHTNYHTLILCLSGVMWYRLHFVLCAFVYCCYFVYIYSLGHNISYCVKSTKTHPWKSLSN
jgi:hypothetical protein